MVAFCRSCRTQRKARLSTCTLFSNYWTELIYGCRLGDLLKLVLKNADKIKSVQRIATTMKMWACLSKACRTMRD